MSNSADQSSSLSARFQGLPGVRSGQSPGDLDATDLLTMSARTDQHSGLVHPYHQGENPDRSYTGGLLASPLSQRSSSYMHKSSSLPSASLSPPVPNTSSPSASGRHAAIALGSNALHIGNQLPATIGEDEGNTTEIDYGRIQALLGSGNGNGTANYAGSTASPPARTPLDARIRPRLGSAPFTSGVNGGSSGGAHRLAPPFTPTPTISGGASPQVNPTPTFAAPNSHFNLNLSLTSAASSNTTTEGRQRTNGPSGSGPGDTSGASVNELELSLAEAHLSLERARQSQLSLSSNRVNAGLTTNRSYQTQPQTTSHMSSAASSSQVSGVGRQTSSTSSLQQPQQPQQPTGAFSPSFEHQSSPHVAFSPSQPLVQPVFLSPPHPGTLPREVTSFFAADSPTQSAISAPGAGRYNTAGASAMPLKSEEFVRLDNTESRKSFTSPQSSMPPRPQAIRYSATPQPQMPQTNQAQPATAAPHDAAAFMSIPRRFSAFSTPEGLVRQQYMQQRQLYGVMTDPGDRKLRVPEATQSKPAVPAATAAQLEGGMATSSSSGSSETNDLPRLPKATLDRAGTDPFSMSAPVRTTAPSIGARPSIRPTNLFERSFDEGQGQSQAHVPSGSASRALDQSAVASVVSEEEAGEEANIAQEIYFANTRPVPEPSHASREFTRGELSSNLSSDSVRHSQVPPLPTAELSSQLQTSSRRSISQASQGAREAITTMATPSHKRRVALRSSIPEEDAEEVPESDGVALTGEEDDSLAIESVRDASGSPVNRVASAPTTDYRTASPGKQSRAPIASASSTSTTAGGGSGNGSGGEGGGDRNTDILSDYYDAVSGANPFNLITKSKSVEGMLAASYENDLFVEKNQKLHAESEAIAWAFESRQQSDLLRIHERELLELKQKYMKLLQLYEDVGKHRDNLSATLRAHLLAVKEGLKSFVPDPDSPLAMCAATAHTPQARQLLDKLATARVQDLNPEIVKEALGVLAASTLHGATQLAACLAKAEELEGRDNILTQYHDWRAFCTATQQKQWSHEMVNHFRARSDRRLLSKVLLAWIMRMRERQKHRAALEVIQARSRNSLLSAAWATWRAAFVKHKAAEHQSDVLRGWLTRIKLTRTIQEWNLLAKVSAADRERRSLVLARCLEGTARRFKAVLTSALYKWRGIAHIDREKARLRQFGIRSIERVLSRLAKRDALMRWKRLARGTSEIIGVSAFGSHPRHPPGHHPPTHYDGPQTVRSLSSADEGDRRYAELTRQVEELKSLFQASVQRRRANASAAVDSTSDSDSDVIDSRCVPTRRKDSRSCKVNGLKTEAPPSMPLGNYNKDQHSQALEQDKVERPDHREEPSSKYVPDHYKRTTLRPSQLTSSDISLTAAFGTIEIASDDPCERSRVVLQPAVQADPMPENPLDRLLHPQRCVHMDNGDETKVRQYSSTHMPGPYNDPIYGHRYVYRDTHFHEGTGSQATYQEQGTFFKEHHQHMPTSAAFASYERATGSSQGVAGHAHALDAQGNVVYKSAFKPDTPYTADRRPFPANCSYPQSYYAHSKADSQSVLYGGLSTYGNQTVPEPRPHHLVWPNHMFRDSDQVEDLPPRKDVALSALAHADYISALGVANDEIIDDSTVEHAKEVQAKIEAEHAKERAEADASLEHIRQELRLSEVAAHAESSTTAAVPSSQTTASDSARSTAR